MSRGDGFDIADISSSIHEDVKFKRLARKYPALVATAFLAYVATLCESWRDGERVSIEDAWPVALVPYDPAVVEALVEFDLIHVGLVERDSWEKWFGPAKRRRDVAREAGRKGNRLRWHPGDDDGGAPDRVGTPNPIAPRSGSDPRPVLPTGPTGPTVRSVSRAPGPAGPGPDAGPGARPDPGPRAREGSDPADTYWTLTGKYPAEGTLKWIDDLAEQYGPESVSRALAAEHLNDSTVTSLLGRAKVRLRRGARLADVEERQREVAKVEAQRQPLPLLQQAPPDVSEEEADRQAREYREKARAAQ